MMEVHWRIGCAKKCLQWVYSGYTVGIQSVYSGFIADIQWVYSGFTEGIQWNYSGYAEGIRLVDDLLSHSPIGCLICIQIMT